MGTQSFWTVAGAALTDAALAVELFADPGYRRRLREDASGALQVFTLARDGEPHDPEQPRTRQPRRARLALRSDEV